MAHSLSYIQGSAKVGWPGKHLADTICSTLHITKCINLSLPGGPPTLRLIFVDQCCIGPRKIHYKSKSRTWLPVWPQSVPKICQSWKTWNISLFQLCDTLFLSWLPPGLGGGGPPRTQSSWLSVFDVNCCLSLPLLSSLTTFSPLHQSTPALLLPPITANKLTVSSGVSSAAGK